MIIYNQAYDLYHTIFRMLQLLNKFEEGAVIETERLRIWDFYLLFPVKIHQIRLKREEKEIKQLRRKFIKQKNNPYEVVNENRKVFEKLKPYQLAAINCIASYGIIDKGTLHENRILIVNKSILNEFVSKYDKLEAKENNVVSLLTLHFSNISLHGSDGLKDRTNLMESKYDA